MKKIIVSVLISSLLILPGPAFAADDRINVNKLTFDKIEQHMNTYNAQMDANIDNLLDIEVPDDDDKALLQGLRDYYAGKILEYQAKKGEIDPLDLDSEDYLLNIYDELIAMATTNRDTYQQQLDSFDENQDKASDARTKAALQTEMANKQIIWGAEQLYLSYNSLGHQISQQRSQLYVLLKQLTAMELRQKLGLITKANYTSLEESVKELKLAIEAMEDQQTAIKEQLNVMFNQNYDTDMEIEATPELDDDLIEEMDLEEDSKLGMWKSYNVRLKDDDWEEEAEERKFALDFKTAYENVLDKKDSLELEEYKLENQKELYKHAELKYKLGLISKLSFDEQKMKYDNQVLNVQIAEEELFKAYRKYEWMKEGLSL